MGTNFVQLPLQRLDLFGQFEDAHVRASQDQLCLIALSNCIHQSPLSGSVRGPLSFGLLTSGEVIIWMQFNISLDLPNECRKPRFPKCGRVQPASLATLFWVTGVPGLSILGSRDFKRSKALRKRSSALCDSSDVGADLRLTYRADPNLTQGGVLHSLIAAVDECTK